MSHQGTWTRKLDTHTVQARRLATRCDSQNPGRQRAKGRHGPERPTAVDARRLRSMARVSGGALWGVLVVALGTSYSPAQELGSTCRVALWLRVYHTRRCSSEKSCVCDVPSPRAVKPPNPYMGCQMVYCLASHVPEVGRLQGCRGERLPSNARARVVQVGTCVLELSQY